MNDSRQPLLSVEDLRLSVRTDGGWHPIVRGLSFDVRPGETLAIVDVVERLLPEVVAGERQAASRKIIEAKRKHATQLGKRPATVFGEKPQQHLRIARRP